MSSLSGKVLNKTLVETSALTDIVGDRIYQRGTLGVNGVPAQPELPYVMIGEDEAYPNRDVRETSPGSKRTWWTVYVYDEPGSVVRIKEIHDIIQEALESIQQVTLDGVRVLEVLFDRSSRDGVDTVRKEGVKTATYRVNFTRAIP